jgi:cold shock protein
MHVLKVRATTDASPFLLTPELPSADEHAGEQQHRFVRNRQPEHSEHQPDKDRGGAEGCEATMTGKITHVTPDKGFGFITGEDGRDYYFHRSALEPGEPFDHLLQGATVTFDAAHPPKGLRAETVRLVR